MVGRREPEECIMPLVYALASNQGCTIRGVLARIVVLYVSLYNTRIIRGPIIRTVTHRLIMITTYI